MPWTHKQIVAARVAEHAPGKLNARNRGLLKMSRKDLHEMATYPDRSLREIAHSGKKHRKKQPNA